MIFLIWYLLIKFMVVALILAWQSTKSLSETLVMVFLGEFVLIIGFLVNLPQKLLRNRINKFEGKANIALGKKYGLRHPNSGAILSWGTLWKNYFKTFKIKKEEN